MAKAKTAKREERRIKEELQVEEDKKPIPAPPDGGYGWVIVLASFICNMTIDGVSFSFGLLLPFLVEHFEQSKGTTAWVGSLLVGFQMGAGPIVSVVANKFGCRVTNLLGCVMASSGVALSTLCTSIPQMMLAYGFLGGVGYSFMYVPSVVMVGYYFESKRSLATGIAVCGTGVGAFVFAPLCTYLLANYGWKTTNLCMAGITISCSLFGALMKPLSYGEVIEQVVDKVPTKPGYMRSRTSEGNIFSPGAYNSTISITKRKENLQKMSRKDVLYAGSIQNLKEFQSSTSLAEYRNSVHSFQRPKNTQLQTKCFCARVMGDLLDFSLLKDSSFLVLGISTFFVLISYYIPFVYLVELAKTKGIDETRGAMLISLIGITNIVARLGVGYVADFPRVNNFLVNNGCLVIGAISVAVMPLLPNFTTLAIASVFFGIAIAGHISLTSILLVEFLGLDKLTDAFGLLLLFRGLAATVGSPIAGTIYDITQSYTIAFLVCAAAFAVGAVISMLTPCLRKKTEEKDSEASAPMNVAEERNENAM